MLIQNFLENSAQRFPDKNAVFFNNLWMSYGEIESHANKITMKVDQQFEQIFKILKMRQKTLNNKVMWLYNL